MGLLRISEIVRAYAYLVLCSQALANSRIIVNTASALMAQKAFVNNFEDIVNRRVDIWEDIKGKLQSKHKLSSNKRVWKMQKKNEPSLTSMRQMVLEISHFRVGNLRKMDVAIL